MGDKKELANSVKKSYKRLRLVFLFVFIVALCAYAATRNNEFRSYQYSFEGNNLLSETELESILIAKNKDSLTQRTLRAVREKLEKHPFIEEATVIRKNSNNIKIQIREIEPLVLLVNDTGDLFFYCKGDKLIAHRPLASCNNYPIVHNVINNDKVNKIAINSVIKILNVLENSNYRRLNGLISDFECSANGDITLLLDNGKVRTLFGKAERIENKLEKLDKYISGRFFGDEFAASNIADLRWKGCLIIN